MIKEITVAGIKLYNYNTIENLTLIVKNLEANVFTSIEEIHMKTILLAKEDETVKEAIESADVMVIAETGILDAVGQSTILRRAEIERREFFFHLMKILERNGYTVYVLGEQEQEVEEACRYITDEFPRMNLVGQKVLHEDAGEEHDVINDINMVAPDVIISVLPSPMQEKFLKKHRSMLLTKIWYGIGAEKIAGTRLTLIARINKFFRKLILRRYVQEELEQEEILEAQKNEMIQEEILEAQKDEMVQEEILEAQKDEMIQEEILEIQKDEMVQEEFSEAKVEKESEE